MNFFSLLKTPSAFLPIAMSLAALALVFGNVSMFDVVRNADEGTAAHIFQLLIATQAPMVVYFAIAWLPKYPKQALMVLAMQAAAVFAALASVFLF